MGKRGIGNAFDVRKNTQHKDYFSSASIIFLYSRVSNQRSVLSKLSMGYG